MKRITQFILCIVLAVSAYGQGVGGNSVPRTVSGISAALDLISSTQGTVFYRGASGWEALPPGTSGQLFSTQGAAANPIWVTATGGAGDVNGPTLGTATDNAIVRFDGTGGKTVQNSAVTIADTTGAMTWATGQAATLTGGDNGASLGLGSGASGSVTASRTGNSAFTTTLQNTTSGTNAYTVLSLVGGARNSFIQQFSEGWSSTGPYVAGSLVMQYPSTDNFILTGGGTEAFRVTANRNLLLGTASEMASTAGGLTVAATGSGATATSVGTGGLRSANFGLSTVSGGASYFGGAVTVSGNNSAFGGAANATVGVYVLPTGLTGVNQYGLAVEPVLTSAATTTGQSGYFRMKTAAAAFTMGIGAALRVDVPTLGAGSAITNHAGLTIANQGNAGITNAYGISIDAPSGSTKNIGLQNLGSTILATPASAPSLDTNSTMTFELTSNTSLTIKVRGTDGTTRSVALTLAP